MLMMLMPAFDAAAAAAQPADACCRFHDCCFRCFISWLRFRVACLRRRAAAMLLLPFAATADYYYAIYAMPPMPRFSPPC